MSGVRFRAPSLRSTTGSGIRAEQDEKWNVESFPSRPLRYLCRRRTPSQRSKDRANKAPEARAKSSGLHEAN
jgi:hypothetical protein